MSFEDKLVALKSGKIVTIRACCVEDARDLLKLKLDYLRNTTTIPLENNEYVEDVTLEFELIKEYINSPNSILLVAEYENSLIGNIDLTGSKRKKMFHTGMIGMGIKDDWRNQGLGKILIEAVINWAKNDSPITLIWLDVYSSNELGVNLYKNTGFKISGTMKNFFKEASGYKDKIQMYQEIK